MTADTAASQASTPTPTTKTETETGTETGPRTATATRTGTATGTGTATATATEQPNVPLTLRETIARARRTHPLGSPCTGICRLDTVSRRYCVGCHRSRDEIKAWKTLDDAAKSVVLDALLERQMRHTLAASPDGDG